MHSSKYFDTWENSQHLDLSLSERIRQMDAEQVLLILVWQQMIYFKPSCRKQQYLKSFKKQSAYVKSK